jgi:hypothetical protein
MSIAEDDAYYKSLDTGANDSNAILELFEMKNFISIKLIELIQLSCYEANVEKIIYIFGKVNFVCVNQSLLLRLRY